MFTFTSRNTFCINADENRPAWESVYARFLKLGLGLTRWPMVSSTCLPTHPYLREVVPNAAILAQTHFDVWKRMVRKRIPYALIVEDDVYLHPNWREALDTFPMHTAFDVLFLDSSDTPNKYTVTNSWNVSEDELTSSAYIISLQAAESLVGAFASQLHSARWMLARLQRRRKCFTYFPWVCLQMSEGDSAKLELAKEAFESMRVHFLFFSTES